MMEKHEYLFKIVFASQRDHHPYPHHCIQLVFLFPSLLLLFYFSVRTVCKTFANVGHIILSLLKTIDGFLWLLE